MAIRFLPGRSVKLRQRLLRNAGVRACHVESALSARSEVLFSITKLYAGSWPIAGVWPLQNVLPCSTKGEPMQSLSRPVAPWNKGRLIGQKAPLKLKEIWAIRMRLQLAQRTRGLALFNLAIDSKLRGGDLLALKVGDISQGSSILPRAVVMPQKTRRPVQFEITDQTRASLTFWIRKAQLSSAKYLFPSRDSTSPYLSTRQYARIVQSWVRSIGLEDSAYGTHSMRRTKATRIYRRTKNIRAVQ